MPKTSAWVVPTFTVLGGLGGLACILEWLGVKPGSLRMTATIPHIFWLVSGLLLFGVSISLSILCWRSNKKPSSKIIGHESTEVHESDPLVYPQFVDDRASGSDKRELQAYFVLVNRSESIAHNIILDPVEINGKMVQFTRHRIAAPLLPKREVCFYPDVVTKENESVKDSDRDLFHIFCLDYIALGDSTICEATKAVRATYQDSLHNLFEVTCELVFDPSAHNDVRIGKRGPHPAIFTRNPKFLKIARAI